MELEGSVIHEEDIVIAGAGIAGLSTALGLHRSGIRSLVLESSDMLRITGFALTTWTNAWRALDCLGIGDILRERSLRVQGFQAASRVSCSDQPPSADIEFGKVESRCVKRRDLLETLEGELPQGTVRYSSKIVSVQKSGSFKFLHLTDGSVVKTKVLIGCDGVNSIVAKWLGLQDPVSAGRSAIRGFVDYPYGHGFEPKYHAYFGGGVRFGFAPCDEKSLYWFCTFTTSLFTYDENERDSLKMKQFVLSKISNAPSRVIDIFERTGLDSISCATLKFRLPWKVVFGNIVKDNVCVAGDALHPMTPDLGQGGCSALEDSIVLVRCLTEALASNSTLNDKGKDECYAKMEEGLQRYAKERRWRSFSLISTAYLVGWVQERDGKVMSFLRNKFLTRYSIGAVMKIADYNFGNLSSS